MNFKTKFEDDLFWIMIAADDLIVTVIILRSIISSHRLDETNKVNYLWFNQW